MKEVKGSTIESSMIAHIKSLTPFSMGNTTVVINPYDRLIGGRSAHVYLHGHLIIIITPEQVSFNMKNYVTRLTLSRVNAVIKELTLYQIGMLNGQPNLYYKDIKSDSISIKLDTDEWVDLERIQT